MASMTEKLNLFYVNFNSHLWLRATILDSITLDLITISNASDTSYAKTVSFHMLYEITDKPRMALGSRV